jgi:hypothetical protein
MTDFQALSSEADELNHIPGTAASEKDQINGNDRSVDIFQNKQRQTFIIHDFLQ